MLPNVIAKRSTPESEIEHHVGPSSGHLGPKILEGSKQAIEGSLIQVVRRAFGKKSEVEFVD